MSSIRKSGKGRTASWVVRWRAPSGGSRQATFAKEREAREHLATIEGGKQAGSYVDASSQRMPFAVWANQWADSRLNLRPSTQARNESLLRLHVVSHFGAQPIGSISQPDLVAWIKSLVQSGLSPASILVCYRLMSACLKSAVQAGHLRVSPCVGVELPRVALDEHTYLDHAEVSRLASAMPERYQALVLLLAYSGLRIGEAAALRKSNVNLLRGSVTVASTATEVRGHWAETAPKTAAGRRTVPIPASVVRALTQHIATYSQPGPDGLIFTAPAGGPLRVNAWRKRVWNPACVTAELVGLTPHSLRHTAVSLWVSAGADLLTIKTWAGHTSSTFSLDRYGHLFHRDSTALLDRLDAAAEANRHTDAAVLSPLFGVAAVLEA